MQFDMKVASRDKVGKGVARTLRREGKIPGILYGQKECLALTLEPTEVRRILHSESGSNSVLNLKISSGKGETKRTAMLRDYQVDPISGAILHADLFEVAMDKSVRVRVPVAVTEGTPIGVPSVTATGTRTRTGLSMATSKRSAWRMAMVIGSI